MPSLLVVAALPLCVAGHGRMTFPPNRNGGTLAVAGTNDHCELGSNSGGLPHNLDTCGYQTRDSFQSQPYAPTNCNADAMTGNLINAAGKVHGDCSKVDSKDKVWKMPWAAPGKAKLWSACGVNGGHQSSSTKDKHGKPYPSPHDGLNLPPSVTSSKWVIGQTAEVGFTLTKNHGGGYQWRICPGHSASHNPPVSCFEANPLAFASDDTVVQWTSGKKEKFAAIKVNGAHVTPRNSEFRTLRIPMTAQLNNGVRKAPCKDCVGNKVAHDEIRQEWDFSLIDTVHVPNVPVGHAWLQWRWDNEQQDQVWTSCADIEIVAHSSAIVV